MDLSFLTIPQARHCMAKREFSALELTRACLLQIERFNPSLKAFITVTAESALEQAQQIEKQGIGKPDSCLPTLAGIPLALKDLYETAGIRTTAGSKFFADHIPAEDACAVQKVKEAGAVIIGKTNLHEIALGVTNINPHYGACRNPWDETCISGGSSGGSAVALATGMCLGSLGTDTGGSIRIPAALCGVVGLKPSRGRISLRGIIPLSKDLDHAGPLARSVYDAAWLLQVMAGYDAKDAGSINVPVSDYLTNIEGGVKGWRMALASGDYFNQADLQVQAAMKQAATVFESLGALIEAVDLSWMRQAALANSLITQAEAAAFHRERLAAHPEDFGADVLSRLQSGAAYTQEETSRALRTQIEMKDRFEQIFDIFDIILLPTTPMPAQPMADMNSVEIASQLTRFTAPFNLTGLPALSLPCGFTQSGLPIGLQIVSRVWAEAAVLRAGQAYEQATDWHTQLPPLVEN